MSVVEYIEVFTEYFASFVQMLKEFFEKLTTKSEDAE